MNASTWAKLFLLAAIWGSAFYFGRIAVLEVPALTIVFFRVGLAAIALWLVIFLTGRKIELTRSLIISSMIMGLLNNVLPFSLILYGQVEIGSGLAAVINAMTPIWTLLVAHFFTRDEKLSSLKLAGILFGFSGVAMIAGGDIWNGLSASALAQFLVLLAALSYGFANVFGKRFKGTDPLLIAACQLTASSVIILPFALIIDQPFTLEMPSQAALYSILAAALLCTAFAYILFFKILSAAGAVNVSLVTFLVPISAILLGGLFLDETMNAYQITGMVMIAIGLSLVDGRLIPNFKKS